MVPRWGKVFYAQYIASGRVGWHSGQICNGTSQLCPRKTNVLSRRSIGEPHSRQSASGFGVLARVRKSITTRFPDSPGGGSIAYNFESLDFKATERKLNAFYAEFEPVAPEKSRPHQHPGVELLYLISGKLDLTIGSEQFCLEEGDAIYFDSAVRHSYHHANKNRCTSVIVTA